MNANPMTLVKMLGVDRPDQRMMDWSQLKDQFRISIAMENLLVEKND